MNFNIRWWSGRWQKPTVLRTAGRGASIGAGCTTCSGAYHAGAVRCSHSQNCVPCESTSGAMGKLRYMDAHTWRQFRADYSVEQLEQRFALEEERAVQGLPLKGRDFMLPSKTGWGKMLEKRGGAYGNSQRHGGCGCCPCPSFGGLL